MSNKKFKRCAYVEYAIHHKKKYEKREGRKLTLSELIDFASPDWKKESEDVRDYFKCLAKGQSVEKKYPKMETSCQRMDTEAPITTVFSVGHKHNQQKQRETNKISSEICSKLSCVDDMLNCEFGVVDVNIHVDCGDGTCVPAEISVSKGSLRQGLSEEFDAVIWINLKRDLREGDAGQVRSNCKTVHGIDIYDQKFEDHSDPVPYTYEEVLRISDNGQLLLLCRKEDFTNVMGSWNWIQKRKTTLPDLKLMTLEDFLLHSSKLLEIDTNPTITKFTGLLSNSTYDFETSFRCNYHNKYEISRDKAACAKKNTRKYFFLAACYLLDFIPKITPINGKHFYKKEIADKGKLRVPSNTPTSRPEENDMSSSEELDYPEKTMPRKPTQVYSSRNNSCKPSQGCSFKGHNSEFGASGSSEIYSVSKETVGQAEMTFVQNFQEEVPIQNMKPPRKPNKNTAEGKTSCCTGSYDKKSLTYDTVSPGGNCNSTIGALTNIVREERVACGRGRGRGNTRSGQLQFNSGQQGYLSTSVSKVTPSYAPRDDAVSTTCELLISGDDYQPVTPFVGPPPGFTEMDRNVGPCTVNALLLRDTPAQTVSFGRGQKFQAAHHATE